MQAELRSSEGAAADRGFTLIELMIVLSLLTTVFALCMTSLVAVQRNVVSTDARTQALDQVRLAVMQIDRQVRSGNIFYTPTANGMNLIVFTQANGNQRCVQWQVSGSYLQSRSWTQTWQTDGSPAVVPWSTIATGVTNDTTTPVTPAFVLDTSSSSYGGRVLNIDVTTDSTGSQSGSSEVQDAVEGRNTVYNYSASACSAPYPAT